MPDNVNVHVTSLSWRPLLRVLIGVAALMLVVVMVRQLTDLLQTILVAAFLAIAADAVARSVQRAGLSRGWSIVTVLVGGVGALLLVVLLLVPPLVKGGAQLVEAAPDIADNIEKSDAWQQIQSSLNLSSSTISSFKDVLVEVPSVLVDFLSSAVNGIFGLVTIFIAVAFLLTGGDRALALAMRLIPRLSTADGWDVVVGAYNNIGKYVVGATLQATAAGSSLAIVLFLLDVPYALPLGVFMLAMDFIPLIGATIGTIPAVGVALFAGSAVDAVLVCAFLIIYQQIENSVIQPRIQGKVVHLPGIAIFFSCMIGGSLLGVLGALIAVPVASVALIIIRQYLVYTGRDQIELPRLFDENGRPVFESKSVEVAES
jgi:predicted PurR-regulated permease PerM